MKIFPIYR